LPDYIKRGNNVKEERRSGTVILEAAHFEYERIKKVYCYYSSFSYDRALESGCLSYCETPSVRYIGT